MLGDVWAVYSSRVESMLEGGVRNEEGGWKQTKVTGEEEALSAQAATKTKSKYKN